MKILEVKNLSVESKEDNKKILENILLALQKNQFMFWLGRMGQANQHWSIP